MVWRHVRSLLRRRLLERDLDEELRYHLERQTEEFVRAGMRPEQARRAALASLGGVEQIKEECRDARGLSFAESVLADARYALRGMRRNPGFTAVAVLCLALGIGANSAIFSLVNAILLRPLPYAESERLVMLFESSRRFLPRTQATWMMYQAWRDRNSTLEGIASYVNVRVTLSGVQEPADLDGAAVSDGFFPLLGTRPFRGRLFAPGEDRRGSSVAVLSYAAWQKYFGGDPAAIGRPAVFSNFPPFTIIGVLPREFRFEPAGDPEVWLPAWIEESGPGAGDSRWYLSTIARLKPGVTVQQAQADLETIARQATAGNSTAEVASLHRELVGRSRRLLALLFAAVTLVLLIAAANAANLQLARAASRAREIAIRAAIGAGRRRVVRQLLVESVTLALAGGAAGLAVAYGGVRLLTSLAAAELPRAGEIAVDARVLAFTFAVAVLSGIVFGLAPALAASRADLAARLHESARSTAGSGTRRLGALIVAGELALAMVLLAGAGLMLHSLWRLVHTSPGFQPEQLLTMRVRLPWPAYRGARAGEFARTLLERLRAMPGVAAVAVTTQLPMGGHNEFQGFEIVGGPEIPKAEAQNLQFRAVSPDYFRAMRIPVLKGRAFTDADADGAPGVAIVSELMEPRYFNGNALGRRILAERPQEIVGVVGNVRHHTLTAEPLPERYVPFAQARRGGINLVVRTVRTPASMASAIRGELRQLEPRAVATGMMSMLERRQEALGFPRLLLALLAAFAAVALALACAGAYGVMSYSIAERTHEIGVRMALGASRSAVVAMVLREVSLPAGLGAAAGLAGAVAAGPLLRRYLFGVGPADPAALAAAAIAIGAAAFLAAFVPALRAARLDPLAALRTE